MGKIILETKELTFAYPDGTKALQGVSVQIKAGKTTAILGNNGAGKSTLFLNLKGMLKPHGGEIFFQGEPVAYQKGEAKALWRAVGLVFQDPDNQLFSASVFQDVSFGPMNLNLSQDEVKNRVEDALQRTGISHLRNKPTHSLSYGQKKRVALAGVLAMEPKLLILDEPTAGLDPAGIEEIMGLIQEMQQKSGISVMISTHDIDLVPLYCDEVYVLNQGRIALSGPPREVFTQGQVLQELHLRLPWIAQLMEVLSKEDQFHFDAPGVTVSQARETINRWRAENK